MNPLKLLIVEDDPLVGEDLAMILKKQGCEVLEVMTTGENAIQYVSTICIPDLILMDVRLQGNLDGIDAAHLLSQEYDIPIVYLTANIDEATYNRAKMTNPYAFVAKPFSQVELTRTIELIANQVSLQNQKNLNTLEENEQNHFHILQDCIFIKEHEKFVKIKLNDIVYLEADRNYSRFFTTTQTYLFSMPLKSLEQKINASQFIRTHRSFVVNLSHLEEVLEDFVVLRGKNIPLSRSYRQDVLRSIKLI